MTGTLYVVGTPIGNKEDITLRALRILREVDVVVCEDTRVTSKLYAMYPKELVKQVVIFHADDVSAADGLDFREKPKLERFDERVERMKVRQVMEWLQEGKNVALVSDAGMPLVSDPGFLLVRECREQNVPIEVVPGPTALSAALAVSGLPTNQVLFLGFLPKKQGKRQQIWEELKSLTLQPTVVIYEAPYRLVKTLEEVRDELGDPEVAAVGELTKLHEKVLRGTASEVLEQLPEKVKGEWVVVVSL